MSSSIEDFGTPVLKCQATTSSKKKFTGVDGFREKEVELHGDGSEDAPNTGRDQNDGREGHWHDLEPDNSADPSVCFDDPANYPDGGWRAYLVVFGSFLGLTVDFGFINSIGSIQSYLNLHQLQNESTVGSSFIFAIFLLLTYVLCLIGGVAFDELGPRIPLIFATILMFFGLFFTGSCNTVPSFIGVLGILTGLGMGTCSAPLTGVVSHWFYRKRSTAFAMATVGGSVGGIIIPLLLNKLYIVVGFTWALRILAFVCLGLMIICILLVSGRKDKICPPEASETIKYTGSNPILHKVSILCGKAVNFRALKEPAYLLCTLGIGFSDLSLVCTLTYFPSYVTFVGYSETKANTIITIINCMGILGRYIPGVLADKIGPYNVMIIMMTATCLSVWVLWLAWSMSNSGLSSIYVFSVIYGFFNSSVLSLAPSCIAAISSTKEFGQRYGTAYLVAGFFVFGGMIGGGAIISEESIENYSYFAIYCGSLYVASIAAYAASRFVQVGRRFKVIV
ncbi:hypothetical protein FOA43_002912 [Brettanomyces nanus]|uniref:Major facilitator superfamily (MFS) profile domain-containing protein n=1 Tax=Eeniella nana TaxID=13502 RepID=A0A875RVI1_EENNA|nr:uncharacterized protein FOA43_002912 [Brettanomyces nanus]QPG75557.1 hypothetical protein FOA43_002912 [Brettanomyces nanus]